MKNEINTISLIGAGNVAHHIGIALNKAGISIKQVWSRDEHNAISLAKELNCDCIISFSDVVPVDLILVAVPDDHVAAIISQLPSGVPIAYTSGSVAISTIHDNRELGVFYPLQSFSKQLKVDISQVPFLIEGNDDSIADSLFKLAKKLSSNVSFADSEYRAKIHLTAVWVNNFTNHILHQAWIYAKKNDVDFDLLKPLLKETVRKLDDDIPYNLQTGPAKRGDKDVITKQLNELSEHQREIYLLLTESIIDTYSND